MFQLEIAFDNRRANNRTQIKIVGLFEIYSSRYYRPNPALSHHRCTSLREAPAGRGSARERGRSCPPTAAPQLAGTGRGTRAGRPRLPPPRPPAPRPHGAVWRAGPGRPRRGLPFPRQQLGRTRSAPGPARQAAAGRRRAHSRSRCGRPAGGMGLELEPLFQAWSCFRRRKFRQCSDLCSQLLERPPGEQVAGAGPGRETGGAGWPGREAGGRRGEHRRPPSLPVAAAGEARCDTPRPRLAGREGQGCAPRGGGGGGGGPGSLNLS